MTPQFAIFKTVFKACQSVGPTYDYVPDAQAKYPFLWVDAGHQVECENNDLLGTVDQTVRIYGKRTDRKQLDEWAGRVRNRLFQVRCADEYGVHLANVMMRVLNENSDGTELLQVVLELRFRYSQ